MIDTRIVRERQVNIVTVREELGHCMCNADTSQVSPGKRADLDSTTAKLKLT